MDPTQSMLLLLIPLAVFLVECWPILPKKKRLPKPSDVPHWRDIVSRQDAMRQMQQYVPTSLQKMQQYHMQQGINPATVNYSGWGHGALGGIMGPYWGLGGIMSQQSPWQNML